MYTPYIIDEFLPGNMISIVIIPLIIFTFAIWFLFYIFEAIGLYKMSKNRGYKNAWIAFIPIINSFALGGIVDNINICCGKKTSWRIWLLVTKIFSSISGLAIASLVLIKLPEFIMAAESSVYSENQFAIINIFAPIFAFSSFTSLISIGCAVILYICLYKIFKDYSPNNEVLFLVLSILLGLYPFFIFALRDKPSKSLQYRYHFNTQQANYTSPQPPTV